MIVKRKKKWTLEDKINKISQNAYKCSGLVHWEDPEGSGREGCGRGDRYGEHM